MFVVIGSHTLGRTEKTPRGYIQKTHAPEIFAHIWTLTVMKNGTSEAKTEARHATKKKNQTQPQANTVILSDNDQ
jgi:hypothetical protein